jgi:hypothetical protein
MTQGMNKELVSTLYDCVAACDHCAAACLNEEDVAMLVKCIKLDMDCADICRMTASCLSRGSELGESLLRECAETCTACAEECEIHAQHGMEHCRICAEACRRCAEACMQTAA